jgi:hypothetical protein
LLDNDNWTYINFYGGIFLKYFMKPTIYFLLVAFFVGFFSTIPTSHAEEGPIELIKVPVVNKKGNFQTNFFTDPSTSKPIPFQDGKGTKYVKGIGFSSKVSRNVDITYNFSHFRDQGHLQDTIQGFLGVQKVGKGDFGKVSFIVYDMDRKIHESHFVSTTATKKISIPTPHGSTNIKMVVRRTKGKNGMLDLFLGNSIVAKTNHNVQIVRDGRVGPATIPNIGRITGGGMNVKSVHFSHWANGDPFMDSNGVIQGQGLGFDASNPNVDWIINIRDYKGVNRIEGTLSLQKELTDKFGEVTFFVYNNNNDLLYKKHLNSKSKPEKISINVPNNMLNLEFAVRRTKGTGGMYRVLLSDLLFLDDGKKTRMDSPGWNLSQDDPTDYTDRDSDFPFLSKHVFPNDVPFTSPDGVMTAKGYGVKAYSPEFFIKYTLRDSLKVDLDLFESFISVQKKNPKFDLDLGTVTFHVLADNKEVFRSKPMNDKSKGQLIRVRIPNNTNDIKLVTKYQTKNQENFQTVFWGDPTITKGSNE